MNRRSTMLKRQYHKEMAAEIERIPSGTVPRLLLHSCCGPCSTAVLEQLIPFFEIVLFFYNPNIAPQEEFDRRLETQKQLLDQLQHPHPITLIAPPYDDAPFWDAVKGAEHTPEMGERCEKCIAQRLEEAAKAADRYGCEWFATTLTVSPHKNAPYINECGEAIAARYQARFLTSDFKKGGGYARSVALSAEYGLYRQDYCGCPMSLREAEERRAEREKKQKMT
ncbi:MAG: epoxyqueuosine reductase QueH [Oscillospiraceae bacterium]|nr:epoxyqueuosine reductase QueH [Oscillospiraceae bacterium]